MARRILLLLVCTGLFLFKGYAQQAAFCNAINAIVKDAPNKFRNIRGKLIEANANATFWESGINVPGAIGARFVYSMGLFYEAAVLQTKNKDEVKAVYDKYKGLLSSCLTPQGYAMTLSDNFYPGLTDYKKVVFMLEEKEEIPPTANDKVKPPSAPAHITLGATYSKDVDKYTVVMYIFEH